MIEQELTDKAVLTKWIETGVGNGWREKDKVKLLRILPPWDRALIEYYLKVEGKDIRFTDVLRLPMLIADPDFMRSAFGSTPLCGICGEDYDECKTCRNYIYSLREAHQYHAQQLIILKPADRIGYLRRALEE